MAQVTDLAAAITRMENTNPAYNNPGGIWDSTSNSIRRYSTLEEGYQALLNTINSKISRGHTLLSFFSEYAPFGHGDNNPVSYANTVGGWLGIPTDVPLSNLIGGNTSNPLSPIVSTPSFSVSTLFPNVAIPDWLLLGVGVGATIWLLTDS